MKIYLEPSRYQELEPCLKTSPWGFTSFSQTMGRNFVSQLSRCMHPKGEPVGPSRNRLVEVKGQVY